MSYLLLEVPYHAHQIKAIQNTAGGMSGVVSVELTDIIDNDLEGFLDILEERLIGTAGMLTDINYDVVGNGLSDSIHIRVTGVVEFIEED